MTGPLSHITVLDFTAFVQGPFATQILGDLGAEVIKFERESGDWMRGWGLRNARTGDETDSFLAFNRNKKSVAADLRNDQTRHRILRLAEDADVVVENFRPGVMDRLGLGYDVWRQANPRIVFASASGYGKDGPYSQRPGQDILVQAMSGLMNLTGRRGEPPTAVGMPIADVASGLHLVIGILAALQHREFTGHGQQVDVDLFASMIAIQQQELTLQLNQGPILQRSERNVSHPGVAAPYGVYPTNDGHIALAMTPCPHLAKILEQPWLEKYHTPELMYEYRDTVHRRLSDHFAQRSTEEWVTLLMEHDVWCAPVQSFRDLESDPQVQHRGLFWDIPIGEDGPTFRAPGSPFMFSLTPAGLKRGVPRVGQHTNEYFC